MRELIVKEYGTVVRTRKGLLVVEGKNGKLELAPGDIDGVVIASGGISITARAVRLLMRNGVDLVFLDERGQPIGRLYTPFINRTVLTRRRQYEAYLGDERWNIIHAIIESKIRNQAGLLRYYSKSLERIDLKNLANEILSTLEELPKALGNPQAVLNLEARVAQIYWGGVAELLPREIVFDGRDHESLDPFNISLNYSYALLYSRCWRVLVLAGLDPYAGFLHTDRSGKESLVYDFSEMFKPLAVDKLLISMFREGWRPRIENGLISRDSRADLIARFSEWMGKNVRPTTGEACTLEQAMKRWAFRLAGYLRGESKSFTGFVETW